MSDQETGAGQSEENKLIAQRREKLRSVREQGNAFPNDFRRSHHAAELERIHGERSREELAELGARAAVAGRVIRMRGPFLVIQDSSGAIQLYHHHKQVDADVLARIRQLDLGDIVGAEGEVFRTGKGELTVNIDDLRLLTKALRPLPDKYKGLADTETRYRQRYVDLIVNEESRRVFELRSRIINAMRLYLLDQGFMEVETPMMQAIPGGATARPFLTHHNALDQRMYLRVAPELYLKRLIVGGLEKVFEINRNFRNEGLSTRHNPEFTMAEFYQAYADYRDLMDMTEDMLRYIAREALGGTQVHYQGMDIDLEQPFERLTVHEAILRHGDDLDEATLADRQALAAYASRHGIEAEPSWGTGRLVMELFEERVEPRLQQPTFITRYPTEVSPLARRCDDDPEVTDRFELIIGGRELANGFSELNDAEDQAARFAEQARQKDSGDEEAMHYDADYIAALEYGMPPTAGEGIGIDRLVMLMTDSPSIKDVLLFPHMRPNRD